MANEGNLPELLDALRWRWRIMALVAVCVFTGATVYVELLPNQFEGEAVVAITPRPQTTVSADTVRVVAPKYVAFVTAPLTVRGVATEIDADEADLEDGLDVEVEPETGNLTITVQLGASGKAADAANAFATEAVDFSGDDILLDAEVVSEAVTPTDPSGPPRRLFEGAALLVGLMLGLAVSFIVERSRPRVRSSREMARLTGYPLVGRLPPSRRLKREPSHAFADPVVGTAFRSLRTTLLNKISEATTKVIVVTSPTKGDGKTTVAALFAESLARLGFKVLLIDADLRRPGIARTFRLRNHPGVPEILRGEATMDEAMQDGWTKDLSVLPAHVDQDAGDLLARWFSDMVREARQRFEVIVADTPPLLGTDDARTLASMASGVLLVVSARSLTETVNEAVLSLETLNAPMLGVLGNRLRGSRHHYYY